MLLLLLSIFLKLYKYKISMKKKQVIRITKEFVFDMAHALYNYDGLCKNIHGHTYKLQVCLRGEPMNQLPKLGMVIDFSDLKRIVKESVVDVYDHALVVNQKHELNAQVAPYQESGKFIELPFQPTCENLVAHFAHLLLPILPSGVELYSIRLYETPTSWSDWYAEDNL